MKNWKFSPIDIAGITKWDDYTKARDLMVERTHKEFAPWIIVRANDKRRARLAIIRRILLSLPYDGRDLDVIGKEDKKIIGEGPSFLGTRGLKHRRAPQAGRVGPISPTILSSCRMTSHAASRAIRCSRRSVVSSCNAC